MISPWPILLAGLAFAPTATSASLTPEPVPFLAISHDATFTSIDSIETARSAFAQKVAITGLRKIGSPSTPDFQTKIYFGSDGQRLLIYGALDEPLLKSEAQQEIKSESKSLDHGAISDDCLCLLFRSNAEATNAFEVTVNSVGAIDDAQCAIDDLWKKRDLSWNSGASAIAKQGEGKWEIFLSIPWANLPLNSSSFEISLVRIAKTRSEVWSWNKIASAHAPQEWGTVQICENGNKPWLELFGENIDGSFRVTQSKSMKSLEEVALWSMESGAKAKEWNYSLVDAATARVLYRSPVYENRNASTNEVKIWPNRGDTIYLVEGLAQSIPFLLGDISASSGKEWKLKLELPPFCKVMAVSGYYAQSNKGKARFTFSQEGSLATISADNAVQSKVKTSTERIIDVVVKCDSPEKSVKPATLRYWLEGSTSAGGDIPQSLNVKTIPDIQGKQPKKFMIQIFGSRIASMDDDNAIQLILKTLGAVGINQLVSTNPRLMAPLKAAQIEGVINVNFEPFSINLTDFLKVHPDVALVDSKGKRSTKYVCPLILVENEVTELIKQNFKEFVSESNAGLLQYDFEYPLLTGPHACYCTRCLTAFNQSIPREKLAAGASEAWNNFSLERNARVLEVMRSAAAACGVPFSVYSGYQCEKTRIRYGIDWKMVSAHKGADIAGCGFGRNEKLLSDTREALGNIPLFCGEVVHPYLNEENIKMDPELIPLSAASLLHRAIDARCGIMIYERLCIDGRGLESISRVSALIANNEDLFLSGDREDRSGWTILRKDKEALYICLNDSSKPLSFQSPILGSTKILDSPGIGNRIQTNGTLAPGDYVAFRTVD